MYIYQFLHKNLARKTVFLGIHALLGACAPEFGDIKVIVDINGMCNKIYTNFHNESCPNFSKQSKNNPILVIWVCAQSGFWMFERYLINLHTGFCSQLLLTFSKWDVQQKRQYHIQKKNGTQVFRHVK